MPDARSAYWIERYQTPDWEGGIHIGHFEDLGAGTGLGESSKASDEWVVSQALDKCSIFRLVTGCRILDFGCGNTGLGEIFSKRVPGCEYVGLDPSPTAIAASNKRHYDAKRCTYLEGGLDWLIGISNVEWFDLIVIREVLYLLSNAERQDLKAALRRLLRPGGLLHFSDMIMTDPGAEGDIRKHLYERHRTEAPILSAIPGDKGSISSFSYCRLWRLV